LNNVCGENIGIYGNYKVHMLQISKHLLRIKLLGLYL